MKTMISNLVCMTRFWNTIIRYTQRQKIGKPNNFQSLGVRKSKGLNIIVNISKSCLCLREENLSFDNNCTFYDFEIWFWNCSDSVVFFVFHFFLFMNYKFKQHSVWLYLQLFVGGCMSYLCYLCLFEYSGVQHILCCVFVLFVFDLCMLCCQFL